ncbi:MAG: hypothetical protein WD070_04965 [Pirellulaceae bacterium]
MNRRLCGNVAIGLWLLVSPLTSWANEGLPTLAFQLQPTEDDSTDQMQAGRSPTVMLTATLPPQVRGEALRAATADLERILQLRVVENEQSESFPMLGSYSQSDRQLSFQPRFPLVQGLSYLGVLDVPGYRAVTVRYRLPEPPPRAAARVSRIEPTGSKLPANALKFYIHFSKPMREGRDIFARFHLVDDEGQEVVDPWRHVELWNEDADRLTLWIHPGRVKQGVNLREELGPVLQPGRSYTLWIEQELRAADGRPLQAEVKKMFTVGEADHQRPLPQDWQLTVPPRSTREPLRASFGEPLDAALLRRMVVVETAGGEPIDGVVELDKHESAWRFTPAEPWQPISHVLVVDPRLEDLAGNTPERIFDTDVTRQQPAEPQLRLRFRPAMQTSLRD